MANQMPYNPAFMNDFNESKQDGVVIDDGSVSDSDSDDEIIMVSSRTNNQDDVIDYGATETQNAAPEAPQEYALAAFDPEAAKPKSFLSAISQPEKTVDDSSISFGDQVAQTIGDWQYAPSAPPLGDDEPAMTAEGKKEYEAWLRSTQISERREFKHHAKWEASLRSTGRDQGFSPVVDVASFPVDEISRRFKDRVRDVLQGESKYEGLAAPDQCFLDGVRPLPGFSNYPIHFPRSQRSNAVIAADGDEAESDTDNPRIDEGELQRWLAGHTESFDEVQDLIKMSNGKYKVGYRNPTKQVVPQDSLWVISSHGGKSSGKQLEVWGPGAKPRFATAASKRRMGRVVDYEIPLNTPYSYCPGRFTIAYILPNELGFLWNTQTSRIEQMLPGRYFIQERFDHYIGKAPVSLGETTTVTIHAQNKKPFITDLANRLKVICVAQGQAAMCMSGEGAFIAAWRPTPWIIDAGRDEEFIQFCRLSDRVSNCSNPRSAERAYSIVNLQPGEYIVFRDNNSHCIVWSYDADEPRFNNIHLPSLFFTYDGTVHKITEGTKTIDNVVVVFNEPQDFVTLCDPRGTVLFLEEPTEQFFVLRAPWRYLETAPKSTQEYACSRGVGRSVWRVVLAPSEWAVVQTQAGEIKFFPPILVNGAPYYFYQPLYTLCAVVNRFLKDVQVVKTPSYTISIVNLSTGELGACRIQNVNMFLNPRPMNPYVFVSPDEFLAKAPAVETHFQAGDLHYVRVNADERVCVVRDGQAMLLPTEDDDLAKENKGNGVYIFRARQSLEVLGPHKKMEESYQLGPWQFFNVPPGYVGYGTKEGKLHVWGEGQGQANVSNNEHFSGFFQTNVDPVVAENVEVMCKHAITSKLTITVTYMITEPRKTIYTFGGDHGKLHRFVESLAISKILELCARSPPMGFSEADFDPRSRQPRDNMFDNDATSEEKTMSEIEREEMEFTDKSKVSGELLNKLRTHPEVMRAGIHIGFAEIQEWKIDESFMASSKEIAMRLQEIHAVTERKRMELAQQKLDNSRLIEAEQSKINQQKLVVEQDRLIAESVKAQAIILAEQEAATIQAGAEAQARALAAQVKAKAEAQTTVKKAELEQRELEAESDKNMARLQQEKQAVVLEQQRLEAESKKSLAIIEAQQQGQTKQAFAEAEAACLAARTKADAEAALALKESQLKQEELSAETAKRLALRKQEQQEIENKTNLLEAQSKAEMRAAEMTSEKMAEARARKEVAQLELEAAQTLLESAKIKAQAELEMLRAQATGQQLLAEATVNARYPGLSPQDRAQCMMTELMFQTQQEVSKRTQQVLHTMDPNESQKIYQHQIQNMMGMTQAMTGLGFLRGGIGGVMGGGGGEEFGEEEGAEEQRQQPMGGMMNPMMMGGMGMGMNPMMMNGGMGRMNGHGNGMNGMGTRGNPAYRKKGSGFTSPIRTKPEESD